MEIILSYELTQEGQRKAIKRGKNGRQFQYIRIYDEKNLLVDTKLGYVDENGDIRISLSRWPTLNAYFANDRGDTESEIVENWTNEEIEKLIEEKTTERGGVSFHVTYEYFKHDTPVFTLEELIDFERRYIEREKQLKKKATVLNDLALKKFSEKQKQKLLNHSE